MRQRRCICLSLWLHRKRQHLPPKQPHPWSLRRQPAKACSVGSKVCSAAAALMKQPNLRWKRKNQASAKKSVATVAVLQDAAAVVAVALIAPEERTVALALEGVALATTAALEAAWKASKETFRRHLDKARLEKLKDRDLATYGFLGYPLRPRRRRQLAQFLDKCPG